jgi:uncharacterized membrane protein YccC
MQSLSISKSRLLRFSKSTDFSKAIILATAIVLPIALGVFIGRFEIGLALALGALLSSSSDVSGSQHHKNYGIAFSATLAVIASLIGGYLEFDTWWGVPLLGLIFFAISYMAVFGFRASLISFSGLFALVLSFANISNVLEIYERAILIGLGGIWYLCLTIFWSRINPKAQTNQYLAQTFQLTSKYLQTRAKLIVRNAYRRDMLQKLLELQAELNEKHETLRDILISARKESGNSGYERRRLLIFIQLIDIMELAMANPVNYKKMDLLMEKHPEHIESFEKLILEMAKRLTIFSVYIENGKKPPPQEQLQVSLRQVKKCISEFKNLQLNYFDEGALMLQSLYDYQEMQVEKINKIERLLLDPNLGEIAFVKKEEIIKFLTPQEYNPKILLENFSFKSTIFKHSLRMAIIVMVGFVIGEYFSLQNAYWILLTVIVIMRPNYGLTKTRSKQRTAGTLIGAGIAIGIVLLTQNTIIYAILAVISLVTAFAMVQKNYKTSATFVTLSVVFVYALLEPDVLNVIQFRVIDTMIGAALATVGNLTLWPSWEFLGIKNTIAESIRSNKEYLNEVAHYYEKKGKVSTGYKVSRKEAFLGIGNLSSAFQRMAQEPRSKQKNLKEIYEVVTLNHSFLSSLASIGTYIQNHQTTAASKYFKTYAKSIDFKLENTLNILDNGEFKTQDNSKLQKEAEIFFYNKMLRDEEGQLKIIKEVNLIGTELQETQVIFEQLKWLLELSTKLEKKVLSTNF